MPGACRRAIVSRPVQALFQEPVHEAGAGLAAGRLQHLAHEESQKRGLAGLVLPDLRLVLRDDRLDRLADRTLVGHLTEALVPHDLGGILAGIVNRLEDLLGDLSGYRSALDHGDDLPETDRIERDVLEPADLGLALVDLA